MPKSINRPRDDAEVEQMQQSQADFAENNIGEQMGDTQGVDDRAEQQSPA